MKQWKEEEEEEEEEEEGRAQGGGEEVKGRDVDAVKETARNGVGGGKE